METIYKGCSLVVIENKEGLFELAVTDIVKNVVIIDYVLDSNIDNEETLLDKLKIFVDEYKNEPKEFLEYSIPKTR